MWVKNGSHASILDGLSSFIFIISAYKSYYTSNLYWKIANSILILSSFLCNIYKSNVYFLFFDYLVIYAISTTYIILIRSPVYETDYTYWCLTPSSLDFSKLDITYFPFAKCSIMGILLCGIYYYFKPTYDIYILLRQFFNIIKNTSVAFSFYLCYRNTRLMYIPVTTAIICYIVKTYLIRYIVEPYGKRRLEGGCNEYYRMYIIYYWTTWVWHFSIAVILYFSSDSIEKYYLIKNCQMQQNVQ